MNVSGHGTPSERNADDPLRRLAFLISTATANNAIDQLLVLERKVRALGTPSFQRMRTTGLARAVSSKTLHAIRTKEVGSRFQLISTAWRNAFRAKVLQQSLRSATVRAASSWCEFITEAVPEVTPELARTVAAALHRCSFETWQDLVGADPAEIAHDCALADSSRAVLEKTISFAATKGLRVECHTSRSVNNCAVVAPVVVQNADTLAQTLSSFGPDVMQQASPLAQQWGLHDLSTTPSQRISQVQHALVDGLPLQQFRREQEMAILVQSAPKSLPQIASALRCWQRFAVDVLKKDACATLPPASDSDVIFFMTIFRNAGTCANYVSALRFGCRLCKLSTVWDTDRIKHALRGVHKRSASQGKPRKRISRDLLVKLVDLAHASGDLEEASLYVYAYTFLLRVEDECIPLQAGRIYDSESYTPTLPVGRHSAVWCDGGELVVRLRSRKSLPMGSTLRRGCLCRRGLSPTILCPVHELSKRLTGLQPGQQLFPTWSRLHGSRLRASLRQKLALVGIPDAGEYGLQSFRRGHAHQILQDGGNLAEVLKAGQWKSPAFALYVDMAEVEAGAVVEALLEND